MRVMLSTLKNLFSPPPAAAGQPADAPEKGAVRRRPPQGPVSVSPRDIDAAFYGLILGVQSPLDCYLNGFEKKALREIDQLLASDIAHSNLVPRNPSVIPQVMSVLRDQDASTHDIAVKIGLDAVLVSEIIRLANSPEYRSGEAIDSLECAVGILGRAGVRRALTNATFKPLVNLNAGHFTSIAGTLLWDQAQKAAIACDCMAEEENLDRFNAYLMAIVQNVGLIVILKLLDTHFDGREAPRAEQFRDAMVQKAGRLTLMIARQWGFPEPVLAALSAQTGVTDVDTLHPLACILYVGDKLAKMHILTEQGRFKGNTDRIAGFMHGRLAAYCDACYTRLAG